MRKIIAFVLSFLICGLTFMSCSTLKTMKQSVLGASEDDIIAEAEVSAKKKFYDEWGIVADEMSSEIIYSNDEKSIVAVKCHSDDYVGDDHWASSIAIVISNSSAMWLGQTNLMPGDYDYSENLEALKSTLRVE